MKKPRGIVLSKSLKEAFAVLPMSASAATTQALLDAHKKPELLLEAMRMRFTQPYEENDQKTSLSLDERLDSIIKQLSDMTKLPAEQVIRLAMEAYIQKL